ncbi:NADH dehydrogenase 1 alpha subcomplex assembly factor 5 [Diplonema papillatum]|nr:NADH dehydrogenase 1 alpha subcomplex assembly factor 5 [Diplonema papillatum]|eukprot:gene14703-22493_t
MRAARRALAGRLYSTAIPTLKKQVAPGTGDSKKKQVSIFNRAAKRVQRRHVAELDVAECKLHKHIAGVIMERLSYVQREFGTVLELGCGRGLLSKAYLESKPAGLKKYMQCDMNQEMLDSCFDVTCAAAPAGVTVEQYCVDEDKDLPFPRKSVDLVVTMLSLHWVNDIESTLRNIRRVLKQDGVVFVCVFGGNTLTELQSCFTVGEHERDGGVSPHVSPFLTGPSMGDLLNNAGFNFPTVDVDRFTFYWDTPFHLMEYLQLIGESNVLFGRRGYVGKDAFLATAAIYDHLWRDGDAGVPATFELVHGVGWTPHPSHAEPSVRGTGQSLSLKDIAESLGEEMMTEETTAAVGSDAPEASPGDTRQRKKEKLEQILQDRGVSRQQLHKMEELMKQRLAGDESETLENEIMDVRRGVQASYDPQDDAPVKKNLPKADRKSFKNKEVREIRGASVIMPVADPENDEVIKKMNRQANLLNTERDSSDPRDRPPS